MAKSTLIGYVAEDSKNFRPAKTQEVDQVVYFSGPNPKGDCPEYFRLEKAGEKYRLKTPKGEYLMTKMSSSNRWTTEVGGTRIYLSPKKIVAHLSW